MKNSKQSRNDIENNRRRLMQSLAFAALLAIAAIAVVFAMPEERVWAQPVGCGGDPSTSTNLTVEKKTVDNKVGTFPFTIKAWKEGGGTTTYKKIAEISFSEDNLEASISTNGDFPIEIPGIDFSEGYRFYYDEGIDDYRGDEQLFNFAAELYDGKIENLTIDGEEYPVHAYSEGSENIDGTTYEIYGLYVDESTSTLPESYYYPGAEKTVEADTLYWNFESGVAVTSDPGAHTFNLSQGGSQGFNIPEGYQYEIIEGDTAGWELDSITSTGGMASKDDKKVSGTMGASGGHKATFTNKSTTPGPDPDPDPGTLTVTKKTVDDKEGSFPFTIRAWKEGGKTTYRKIAEIWLFDDSDTVTEGVFYDVKIYTRGDFSIETSYGTFKNDDSYYYAEYDWSLLGSVVEDGNEDLRHFAQAISDLVDGELYGEALTIDGEDYDVYKYDEGEGAALTYEGETLTHNIYGLYVDESTSADLASYYYPDPKKTVEADTLYWNFGSGVAVTSDPGAHTFNLSQGGSQGFNIPEGYQYEVTEGDTTGWELDSVESTGGTASKDDKKVSGTMSAGGAHKAVFTNKSTTPDPDPDPDPGKLTVTKKTEGDEPGTFSFKIKASKDIQHTYKSVAAFCSDPNGGLVVDTIDYDGLTTIFGLEIKQYQSGGGRATNKDFFSGPLFVQMDNILEIANSYYTGGESGTFKADFVKAGSVTIDGSEHDLFVKLQDLTTAAGGIYRTPVQWSDSANKLVWRYALECCDFYFPLYIIDDDNQIDYTNYNKAYGTSLPNPVTITTSEYLDLSSDSRFTPVSGEPGAYTFTLNVNGSAGASIDIPIPDGYEYTVEEIDIPADWKLDKVEAAGDGTSASESTASGTMVENGAHTATFTNTKNTVDLTVEKEVAGNMGDRTRKFEFSVSLTGAGASDFLSGYQPAQGQTVNAQAGIITFSLAHGESSVIEGIPKGIQATASEANYESQGYKTYIYDSSGVPGTSVERSKTVTLNADTSIKFHNRADGAVPTEIRTRGMIVGFLIAGLFLAALAFRRWKMKEGIDDG